MVVETRILDSFGYMVPADVAGADPTLALSAMPGDIFGKPGRTLEFSHIANGQAITIDTDELGLKVLIELSPESADFLIAGLSVEPRDTRFARVAAELMKRGAPARDMAVGFVNAYSYDPMTLFYFDRPCRVNGKMYGIGGVPSPTTYAVDIKKAGFAWLVAVPQEGGGEIVVVANESTPTIFIAAPMDNINNGRFRIK